MSKIGSSARPENRSVMWKFDTAKHRALAKKSECFETEDWAIEAILDVEILTQLVVDPCCGQGQMADAAAARGHSIVAFDKYDWGNPASGLGLVDFLKMDAAMDFFIKPFTVFMNPPFSLAGQFVERAKELGARKIVCFQRFAWWEGQRREAFWTVNPPNRIYVCAKRASCWRIDIPPEKRTSGTNTAHAWFVWEAGHPGGTLVGRLM